MSDISPAVLKKWLVSDIRYWAIRPDKRGAIRWVGFAIAILLLPAIPVGTVIGLYAIWALNKIIKDEPTAQIAS